MTTTASSGSLSPGSANDRTAFGGFSAKLLSPAAQTALPPAALAYSRLGEIPLEQARAGAGSATWCGRSPGRSRAHHPCRGAAAVEAVRQLVRERLGLPGEVRL